MFPPKFIRYWIVPILDKQDFCFADLVSWAEGNITWNNLMDLRGNNEYCRLDCSDTGSCYCGKFKKVAK